MTAEYLTACGFAQHCLGTPAVQPLPRERFDGPALCKVCGGDAHAHGGAFRCDRALTSSFGPFESFAERSSPAVCAACVHFSLGRTFQEAVAGRNPPLKMWPQVSWRSYSHVFSETLGHLVPRRGDWRMLLVEPPQGRLLAVMTTAGMKNLIYRAPVAQEIGLMFPMMFEEAPVWVDRGVFLTVLFEFEEALGFGLRRDELLSGNYSAGSIFKVGRALWSKCEDRIGGFRIRHLQMLRLAHAVASNPAR